MNADVEHALAEVRAEKRRAVVARTPFAKVLKRTRSRLGNMYNNKEDRITADQARADRRLLRAALVPLDNWLDAHPALEQGGLGAYLYRRWDDRFSYHDIIYTLLNWGAEAPFEEWFARWLASMECGFADCDGAGMWARMRAVAILVVARFALTPELERCVEECIEQDARLPPPYDVVGVNQWAAHERLLVEMAKQTVWHE